MKTPDPVSLSRSPAQDGSIFSLRRISSGDASTSSSATPPGQIALTLTRIIHDGSSRNRAVAKRDRRAEPGGREASLNRMLTDRAASLPAWAL